MLAVGSIRRVLAWSLSPKWVDGSGFLDMTFNKAKSVLGSRPTTRAGMEGAILQMVNHGVSTGALFLLVGVIYDRRHTRLMNEFGGLRQRLQRAGLVVSGHDGHHGGKSLILKELVPKKGLEPPHPCEYVDLNHARLPIPPLRHGKKSSANGWTSSNF